MAEFVEIMKQKERMCHIAVNCVDCQLFMEDVDGCDDFMLSHPAEAEEIIMAWAAEHPEPQYPSWNEAWKQLFPDAAEDKPPCGRHFMSEEELHKRTMCPGICYECRSRPIPADIAVKLGIKPLEEQS